MGRLDGKRAIVTGAGSGIGRASALRFAAEGAAVLAVDLLEEAVAETVEKIARTGGRARALAADAGDEKQVAELVRNCVASFGGLEAVYANAGITGPVTPIFDVSADDWG